MRKDTGACHHFSLNKNLGNSKGETARNVEKMRLKDGRLKINKIWLEKYATDFTAIHICKNRFSKQDDSTSDNFEQPRKRGGYYLITIEDRARILGDGKFIERTRNKCHLIMKSHKKPQLGIIIHWGETTNEQT